MRNKAKQFILEKIPDNNRYERIWKIAQVDFKKRYFNTKLGLLWALINPLFRLFVFYFVFSWIGRQRGDNYGIYIFGALIIWMSFMEATSSGIRLLHAKKYLLMNIQFNKLDIFISNTTAGYMGFAFNLAAYMIISIAVGIPITKDIIWLPFLVINLYLMALGISLILAVINIYLKDIHHAWSMFSLLGFWTMPSVFPMENFTGKLQILLWANPVAGILVNFRNIVFYNNPINYSFLIYNFLLAVCFYIIGEYLLERHWQYSLEKA